MSKKILVADDDRRLVFLMKEFLEGRGYSVVSAENGEDAVEKTRQLKPDLLLLDVRMPKLDGDEVYMVLKADPATKHIPILMLTGLRSEKEILENKEENILAKPVNLEALFAKIKELVGV